jgi:hypothetical protein
MPALQTSGAVRDPRAGREGKGMMTLALALALQGQPMPVLLPPPTITSRIYTSKTLHVGVRSHVFASTFETGYGLTVQITWLHLL